MSTKQLEYELLDCHLSGQIWKGESRRGIAGFTRLRELLVAAGLATWVLAEVGAASASSRLLRWKKAEKGWGCLELLFVGFLWIIGAELVCGLIGDGEYERLCGVCWPKTGGVMGLFVRWFGWKMGFDRWLVGSDCRGRWMKGKTGSGEKRRGEQGVFEWWYGGAPASSSRRNK
ncbi:hypothetical protein KY284_033322 [Solanum tuberosum]|nr:hypothetical protein KY284_033322 [Solanum tuberosum]